MSVDSLRVAAVLVTHDSERFLPELIASIQGQTRAPDEVIVIDDCSTDQTIASLWEVGWTVETATTSATDVTTRIAQNFTQGVLKACDFDIVILGDHDDFWLPDRIEHQIALLQANPNAWFLASNGRIMGSSETLRDTFPVPGDWHTMSRSQRLRYALRHSVATGGASAIRPSGLLAPDNTCVPVPTGWLHDRWWSLAATARQGILIDDQPVIEYRVQSDQRVGLDLGRQGSRVPRMRTGDIARVGDVLRLL